MRFSADPGYSEGLLGQSIEGGGKGHLSIIFLWLPPAWQGGWRKETAQVSLKQQGQWVQFPRGEERS